MDLKNILTNDVGDENISIKKKTKRLCLEKIGLQILTGLNIIFQVNVF